MDTKVHPFSIRGLMPEELALLAQRILALIPSASAQNPLLAEMATALQAKVDQLQSALGKARISAFTTRLSELGRQRVILAKNLRDYLQTWSRRFTQPEAAQQASGLLQVLETASDDLYSLAQSRQGSALNIVLEELSRPAYTDALKAVGAETWVEELRQVHGDYEKLYARKVEVEGEGDAPPTTALVQPVVEEMRSLLGHLEYQMRARPADYQVLVGQVNALLAELSTVAKTRRTRREGKEEGSGEPTPAPVPGATEPAPIRLPASSAAQGGAG